MKIAHTDPVMKIVAVYCAALEHISKNAQAHIASSLISYLLLLKSEKRFSNFCWNHEAQHSEIASCFLVFSEKQADSDIHFLQTTFDKRLLKGKQIKIPPCF